MPIIKKIIITCIFYSSAMFINASLATENKLPKNLEDVKIVEKLGNIIPLDLSFKDSHNKNIKLKEYFNHNLPVVLTLVYFDCPILCHLVLDGFSKTLNSTSLKLGKDFKALTISFNPKDFQKKAFKAQEKYLNQIKNHQKKASNKNWTFLVGNQKNISKLTEAIGFKYKYLQKVNEFSHGAAIFVLSPKGKITRYLYGINYKNLDFKLAISEAKKEKERSTLEKILLYCYRYDTSENSYVLHAINTMKIGGGLTCIFLGIFLINMFIKEKNRNKTV